MLFLGLLMCIVLLTLTIALCVSEIEKQGGFIGDYSLVPGVLFTGLFFFVVTILIGYYFNHFTVIFN